MTTLSFVTADNDFFRSDVAARYAGEGFRELFPPEAAIYETLDAAGLETMAMLDLGVGGGRTTAHFRPHARSYVGLDCSPSMIQACRRRFGDDPDGTAFVVGDACDLAYSDASFDFVLFSFNGLDDVDGEHRVIALREIRRVLRDDGWFAFSTHNVDWTGLCALYSLPRVLRMLFRPRAFLDEARLQIILRRANRTVRMRAAIEKLRRRGHGTLYDNSGVRGYYVTDAFQRDQLTAAGFDRICAFTTDGERTDQTARLNAGYAITYLARASREGAAPSG